MAKEVIKKDGSRQLFDPEKIKGAIKTAAREAKLDEDKTKEVVEKVGGSAIKLAQDKEEIRTSELKGHILEQLDEVEPSVSRAWREYDQKNKPEN